MDAGSGLRSAGEALLAEGAQQYHVFLSHWHYDHADGNLVLGPTGTWIVAQANSRAMLLKDNVINTVARPPFPQKAYPAGALPVATFTDRMQLHFNGETIDLLHAGPAHTTGDAAVIFRNRNVVHMGDQFVNGFPFVDFNSGGSVEGFIKTIAAVLQKIPADAKIIPGHGKLSTVDDLKNYHAMLLETTDFVRKQIAEGKPLADIKSKGLPEKYKSFGGGFINADRWIEAIHREATKK